MRGAGRVGYRERRGEGGGYLGEPVERPSIILLCPIQVAQTPAHFSRARQGVATWGRGVAVRRCGSVGGVAVGEEGQAETHRT